MEKITELRESYGLTIRQLARFINATPSTLFRIERGERKLNIEIAKKLASFFNVSIESLFKEDTAQPKYITAESYQGNRLKYLRIQKGITLRQLADEIGLDHSTLSSQENGKRGLSVEGAIKLARYFNVTLEYLLCLSDTMPDESTPANWKPIANYIRTTGKGYERAYMPESTMADKEGWVLLHRAVMAKHLGRDLRPEEVVHHIDGNPKNNALSNLMLFPNNAEHLKYHGKVAAAKRCDEKIAELLKK